MMKDHIAKQTGADYVKTIGGRIRGFRRNAGLTQIELAKKLSISPSVISNLESGKSMVGIFTLLQILDALGVGIDELFREYSRTYQLWFKAGLGDLYDSLVELEPMQRRKIANHVTGMLLELNSEERAMEHEDKRMTLPA